MPSILNDPVLDGPAAGLHADSLARMKRSAAIGARSAPDVERGMEAATTLPGRQGGGARSRQGRALLHDLPRHRRAPDRGGGHLSSVSTLYLAAAVRDNAAAWSTAPSMSRQADAPRRQIRGGWPGE